MISLHKLTNYLWIRQHPTFVNYFTTIPSAIMSVVPDENSQAAFDEYAQNLYNVMMHMLGTSAAAVKEEKQRNLAHYIKEFPAKWERAQKCGWRIEETTVSNVVYREVVPPRSFACYEW